MQRVAGACRLLGSAALDLCCVARGWLDGYWEFARGLYATHNTVLPVLASLAGFALTVSVTLVLVEPIGVIAIPMGFTAGAALRAVLQGLLLARRIRGRDPVPAAG